MFDEEKDKDEFSAMQAFDKPTFSETNSEAEVSYTSRATEESYDQDYFGEYEKPRKRRYKLRLRVPKAVALGCCLSVLLWMFGFACGYMFADSGELSATAQQTQSYRQTALNLTNGAADSEMTIPEIAAATANSVVAITTESMTNSGWVGQFVTEGAGSGVIISTDGYIITNNHVISDASKITVTLADGKEYQAKEVGHNTQNDIAVLKIDATGLQPAVYGDSDKLVVGDLAVAVGNPLGELGGTVTEGIISALNRQITIGGEDMTLLQISAAVNPGNSGGALFNGSGELVGIVNAKSSGGDVEGIGFAIPINIARSVADQIIEYGYVPGQVAVGVSLVDVSNAQMAMLYRVQKTGVYIAQVNRDDLDLQVGDRIVSVAGQEVTCSSEVKSIIRKYKVGDNVTFVVERNGENVNVKVSLQESTY